MRTTAVLFSVLFIVSFSHPNCLADVVNPADHELHKRADFSYDNPSDWGSEFPTCIVVPGNYQSPINFDDSLVNNASYVSSASWPTALPTGTFKNTGHSIQVDVPADSNFKLRNQGIDFQMAQFHLHVPSEHTEFSQQYDLEAHFVQGVWFKISSKESLFFRSLLQKGVPQNESDSFLISNLDFTEVRSAVMNVPSWAYLGTLTTPPCTGNVRWTVSKIIISMSQSQFDLITSGNSNPLNLSEGNEKEQSSYHKYSGYHPYQFDLLFFQCGPKSLIGCLCFRLLLDNLIKMQL
jgi:carbonic anhydrase